LFCDCTVHAQPRPHRAIKAHIKGRDLLWAAPCPLLNRNSALHGWQGSFSGNVLLQPGFTLLLTLDIGDTLAGRLSQEPSSNASHRSLHWSTTKVRNCHPAVSSCQVVNHTSLVPDFLFTALKSKSPGRETPTQNKDVLH